MVIAIIIAYCCSSFVFFLATCDATVGGWSAAAVEGPWFTVEPASRLELNNQTGASISCSAAGHPTPLVHWVLAGSSSDFVSHSSSSSSSGPVALGDIPGLRQVLLNANGNATLILHPFPVTSYRPDVHSVSYRCRAASAAGTVLSREMKLRTVLSQSYEVQAVAGTAIVGGVAVLRCSVPPAVRSDVRVIDWIQEFTGLILQPSLHGDGKHHVVPSTSTADLYVYGVEKSDARAAYRCRTRIATSAMDASITSSNAASVIVTDPAGLHGPSVQTTGTKVIQAAVDSSVALPCLAQGYPTPEIRWFRVELNGQPTPMDEWTVSFGVLILEHVQPEDAATYRCTAVNSVGQAQHDIRLEVNQPLAVRLETEPAVLVSSSSVFVHQGQSVTVKCSSNQAEVASVAVGSHQHQQQQQSMTVKWLKDGLTVVSLSGSAKYQVINQGWSLKVINMQRSDQGIYQCFVSTDQETAQSSVRLVLGDAAPLLVQTFSEQTLVPGPFVTLRCTAAGNPPPDFTWLLDRHPIVMTQSSNTQRMSLSQIVSPSNNGMSSEVTAYLNISSAAVEDGGEYTCLASNQAGQVAHSARLNIYGLPYIRPIPKVTAVAETDVSIKCPAAGYPLMDVVWNKGDEVLTDSGKFTLDQQTGILTIRSVNPTQDKGVYSCTARDRQGHAARREFSVDVVVGPKISPFAHASIPSAAGLLKLGERLTLTCAIVKGDLPLIISWTLDGRPVITSSVSTGTGPVSSSQQQLAIKAVQIDAYTSLLSIDSLRPVHSGNYTCNVRHPELPGPPVSQSQLVLIQVPPYWIDEPRDVSVLIGQPLAVSCRADGYPKPNVTWSRNIDSTLSSNNYPGQQQQSNGGLLLLTKRTTLPGLRLLDNGTLLMHTSRKSHQGRYTCRAFNSLGQELTATISLTVHAGPRFGDATPSRVAVKRDDAASMHCRVNGDVPIHLAWRRSSSSTAVLTSNHRLKIQDKEVTNGFLVSTLTLHSAQVEDSGVYICIASNAHGQVERNFQLTVLEPPDHPRQLQVKETSSRRLSLSWLAPTGNSLSDSSAFNPLIAYIVQYKETNQGTWQETDGLPVYITSYTLDGLQPSTSYQTRVLAETSAGRGPPSETIVVLTRGEAPGSSPIDLRATAVSSSNVKLTWPAIARSAWHSHLVGYHVGFRLDNAASYNFTTVPLTDREQQPLELMLGELRRAAKYSIVVRAFNRYGEGPLSPAVFVSTLEDVPSASPQLLRCTATSPSTVDVTWQPPPVSEHNGLIQHYRIQYQAVISDASNGGGSTAPVKTVQGLYVTLTGLAPHSVYRVRVSAVNRIGSGPLSTSVTCVTDETVPGPPADVKALSSGSNAITLCWSPPALPNGDILHYTVNIKSGGGQSAGGNGGGSAVQRYQVAGGQTHYEMTGLTSLAPPFYEIWLTATNRAGIGDKSKVLRHSLSFKGNSVSICSFGRRLTQPSRTSLELPCRVIGSGFNKTSWTFNGQPIMITSSHQQQQEAGNSNNKQLVTQNGTSFLVLTDLKNSDAGNYSCSIKSEAIVYQLTVAVAPTPPTLHVIQASADRIQLHWKTDDMTTTTTSSSARGFLLHWRHPDDGGDWLERELDPLGSSAQLDNLRCGTRYQMYVTAYNAVGSSGPSNTVTARTKGEPPLVPSASSEPAVSANITHLTVQLSGWKERGCPIRSFGIDYRMEGDAYWITVSDEIQNLAVIFIDDLQPSTSYEVRVRARTSSISAVTVEYSVVTLDVSGQLPTPERVNRAGSTNRRQHHLTPGGVITTYQHDSASRGIHHHGSGSHVVLPWWLIGSVSAVGTASMLGLFVACFCLYRTRRESRNLAASSATVLPSSSTMMDTGPNGAGTWNKSNKSTGSSTAYDRSTFEKRNSTFELHNMTDKMSNYSEDHHDDIYPYATFELLRDRPRSPVKILDQPPDFTTRLKYTNNSSDKLLLPTRPPPTWSELSTIQVDRHFQISPSVSDSDLENLASPHDFDRSRGSHQQRRHERTNSSSGVINGFIHQPKEYASKSSLKRLNCTPKEDFNTLSSTLPKNHRRPHRPSHPVPTKKLPTLRLIDQSNLWSGHQDSTLAAEQQQSPSSWSPVFRQQQPISIVRPKPTRTGKQESQLDHSIAV